VLRRRFDHPDNCRPSVDTSLLAQPLGVLSEQTSAQALKTFSAYSALSKPWAQNNSRCLSSSRTSKARYSGCPKRCSIVPNIPRSSALLSVSKTLTLAPMRASCGCNKLTPVSVENRDRTSASDQTPHPVDVDCTLRQAKKANDTKNDEITSYYCSPFGLFACVALSEASITALALRDEESQRCYYEYNHIMWMPYWGRSRRTLRCASPLDSGLRARSVNWRG
jgi:hypothetical protein